MNKDSGIEQFSFAFCTMLPYILPCHQLKNKNSTKSLRSWSLNSPEKIVLFGSRSRGNAKSESDYDILIIEKSELPRYKRAAKYRRALKGIGVAKDIVVWTPNEIAEWRAVPNAFITTALREGVVLYEG